MQRRRVHIYNICIDIIGIPEYKIRIKLKINFSVMEYNKQIT